MTADPLVYIIIVNYGRASDTIECLVSLGALTGPAFRVVLVDNGSPSDSAREIADFLGCAADRRSGWKQVSHGCGYSLRFIPSPENLGFAGGCNIGMREALADPAATHVWLLNNDTLVEPDSLAALLRRCQPAVHRTEVPVSMCGSTLIYYKPKDVLQGCGGRFDISRGRGRPIAALNPREHLPEQAEVERDMDYVIGASMLVSIDLIRQVGLMDERYFLYFEELDWALRARAQGFRLGWAPDSWVVHKEGAAIGTSMRARPSAMATYFMTAGYLRLVWALRRRTLPAALAISAMRAANFMLQRDLELAGAVFQAITAFVRSPTAYVPGSFRGVGTAHQGKI
ncbi:glycosyltransferase family 2 protein [Novosphingobium sediminicola]|uniref:Glycosyltransferase 2-like domain-containing protein n=1 Tax=Novosphingobium sediminicola TaxID=563162 RepID=A0A7W6G8A4_9SPHN|nr:glycosyltransferase family 2 protein [Novosphingobium sediminicola]MBB3957774.1 hypothetical protein [Novosphingobium sediminicola]